MRGNVRHTHLCVGVRCFRYFVVVVVQIDIYESEYKFTIYLFICIFIYLLTTALEILVIFCGYLTSFYLIKFVISFLLGCPQSVFLLQACLLQQRICIQT